MTAAEREAALEFARHLASHEPRWETTDSLIQIRTEGRRYWVISEVDASRLEGLRELVLATADATGEA